MTSKDILPLHAFSNATFAYSCTAPDMTSADLAMVCCTVSLQKPSYILCLVYVLYSYHTGLTKSPSVHQEEHLAYKKLSGEVPAWLSVCGNE